MVLIRQVQEKVKLDLWSVEPAGQKGHADKSVMERASQPVHSMLVKDLTSSSASSRRDWPQSRPSAPEGQVGKSLAGPTT